MPISLAMSDKSNRYLQHFSIIAAKIMHWMWLNPRISPTGSVNFVSFPASSTKEISWSSWCFLSLPLIVFLVEFMILLRFPSNVSVCVLFSLLFTDIGTMIRVVFHLQIKLIPLPFPGSGKFFC